MDPQILETLVLILHVLAGLGIIGLVLIQHGKGAEAGSGFGGGSSSTVFGSGGAGNFLTKTTTWLAVAFFVTSFGLAYFAKQKSIAASDIGLPQVVEQVNVDSELPVVESSVADVEIPEMSEDAIIGEATGDLTEQAEVQSADAEIPESE